MCATLKLGGRERNSAITGITRISGREVDWITGEYWGESGQDSRKRQKLRLGLLDLNFKDKQEGGGLDSRRVLGGEWTR